ncbi:MAG: phage holin family protein [Myxococcota bacterium]
MTFLLEWLVLTFAVWITALVLPGVHVRGILGAVVVAAIFGVVNFLIGWFFWALLGIGTLGLAWLLAFVTRFVVDAIVLKITDALTDRLKIDGFGWALGAALAMAFLGTAGQHLLGMR